MHSPTNVHPIKRVRSAYRLQGMRDIATAVGFARKLGCSASLLRNVESAIIPLSENLACRIEEITGVSAKWLQSSPNVDDPILDSAGNVWSPPHAGDGHISERIKDIFSLLYRHSPQSLPAFVGAVVEAVVKVELSSTDGLQISGASKMKQRRFTDSYIRPIVGLVEQLASGQHEKFFDALNQHFMRSPVEVSGNADGISQILNSIFLKDHLMQPLAKSESNPLAAGFEVAKEEPPPTPSAETRGDVAL